MIHELLELQRRQREAHLSGDAAAMAALLADDFVSVKDGEVTRPSREASLERFERYFGAVSFIAWDDIEEPVVEMSADGTLATVLVRKRVDLIHEGGEEETIFAWVETWRRRDGRWELAMVASTRR